jgi:hypothetical protein
MDAIPLNIECFLASIGALDAQNFHFVSKSEDLGSFGFWLSFLLTNTPKPFLRPENYRKINCTFVNWQ